MSYLIVLCVIAVEALNLVLLWIALRATMSRVVRPLVAGAGLSGAWGAWILGLVLQAPLAMMALTGAVFALSSVVMGIAIHLATVEQVDRQGGGGDEVSTVSPAGPGGGGADEPAWWPQFERQVAAYAARRGRDQQRVGC